MDKVAVSRAVARLLERGLLEREVHGDDRRRSVLALSEAGYGIHDEVAPLALAFEQKLLAGMEAPERELLFRLLDRLDELELQAEVDVAPHDCAAGFRRLHVRRPPQKKGSSTYWGKCCVGKLAGRGCECPWGQMSPGAGLRPTPPP